MPPKADWTELKIEAPFEFVEPIAELFRRHGKGGVAIEQRGGWNPDEGESPPPRQSAIIRTYLPQTAAYQRHREMIHIGIALVGKITDLPPLAERTVAEREWEEAWKAHFTPLRVGKRLLVQPPWKRGEADPSDIVIEIDPGLAFGTGHHPTTHRTLEWTERLVKPGMHVLDVGAGSGILSIGAAKLGAERAIGVELDKIALKAGKMNLKPNGVADRVRFYGGSLPSPHIPAGSFDLVLANVNSVALTNLAPELARAMKPNASLVCSGILEERLPALEESFAAAGLRIIERTDDDDWRTLVCRLA